MNKISPILFSLLFLLFIVSCNKDSEQQNTQTLPSINVMDVPIITESDNDTILTINFLMEGQSSNEVSFEISYEDYTATFGVDYLLPSNRYLTFSPGETEKSIEIKILGDNVDEGTEEFFIQLINPNGLNFSQNPINVIILDDDEIPNNDTLIIPSTGFSSPLTYSGKTLLWSDEFDASSLDETQWTFEFGGGGWGNNELQYYKKENTSIVDGYLVIEAKNEPYGGRNYTSSRIITKDKFEFQYGRVDIRAALPYGQGIWPALWMLGENISTVSWPACGEIDIMELIGGGQKDSEVHGTLHWSNAGAHAQFGKMYRLTSGSFQDEFHVFSITWTSSTINWFVDGVQYNSISISPAELDEFRNKFFFIFNVAVGGNWPGNPNSSTIFPQRMIVDYVRVFQDN